MDDPWGSPWTTADQDKDRKASTPSKSDLEPPPRAFLSASSSPRIPTISGGQSPWADDEDGFGDWASADAPASTQSGWGGGWGGHADRSRSPSLALPTPRDDEFGKASPIAWPGSIAVPKANGSVFRQPSPDPWSADFQTPTNDGLSTPRLTVDLPSSIEAPIEKIEGGLGPAWDDAPRQPLEEAETTHEGVTSAAPTQDTPFVKEEPEHRKHQDEPIRASIEIIGESNQSRSSSLSGDNTDHDIERQDSPITSVDEDARSRPQVGRRTSGKVLELVSKFDGLARAASEEPPLVRRERSKSRGDVDGNADSDDAGEFEDFEDADADADADADHAAAAPSPESTVTPRVTEQSPRPKTATEATSPQRPRVSSISFEQLVAKFGPLKFDVDLSNVDKLFDVDALGSAEGTCEADSQIPDRVITDSFTDISERKTWYRVSRLGSSRKHNAGDDENYRRVGWPTSTIRQDTIKVVRRWMEEDSIAGRVTLGGGLSKSQNMFGWNSSAEPVDLDAVFGKRKAHAKASSLQISSQEAGPRKTSGALKSPTQRPLSMAIPPTASFGWSSGSPVTQTQALPPRVVPQATTSIMAPPRQNPTIPLKPLGPSSKTPTVPPLTTKAPPAVEPQANAGDEDEDDWGEMVSSPSDPKPAANGFHSMDDAFSGAASHPVQPSKSTLDPISTTREKKSSTPINTQTVEPPEGTGDPWASADLSIFDLPAKPKPKPPQPTVTTGRGLATTSLVHTPFTPTTSMPTPVTAAPASSTTGKPPGLPGRTRTPTLERAFTPTTPLDISSSITLPAKTASPIAGQSEAARRVIAGLPDLSYMLR
ncbi:hypothetical protein QBC46DRAFT_383889 [Diplogelasinospora grovesii]|uniref:Glucan 1, 4-alpha-glucosidase n=1 Tax=Diplogelasinospora grovesii TaxID=303347 RepID=A0AAN6S4P6_9PEZI|nr:hypothetical protein QBC46DRAFT_383889 [Diplogelasinospora grovesii]